MIVAELEALFKGNLSQFEKDARTFEATGKRITSKPLVAKVEADVRSGLASVGRLEDRVRSADPTLEVDADTSKAEDAIDGLADQAEGAGDDGGKRGGKALAAGIVGALATIPIAGALVGIANAAAEATVQGFQDGLAVEVRADRLAATTGLDPATVERLARASGEAYADNFGESIEANMDTARRAVQSGLLDPKATQRDAQQVISSLAGVADLVEEDVSRVARSTAQLLRTGVAGSAQEAFDIIVAGQQAGLNVSEDWLDTLDEYATQWRELGLSSQDVLGLLSQGVRAGARDTDIASDALKEYAIRARDGSATTKAGYDAIGLSAEEMGAKVAAGGESAREALRDTLDGLRAIEDPIKRDAAAVALFGTQAEDLGDALYAMDLDTAAEQFEDLEGRASRALSTLGDNTAADLETAKRNVEVGVQAIQGALAGAFADDIESGAEFVAENREAVVGFLLDAANAALDFGRATVEGAAAGTEALGDFASSTIGPLIDAIADMALAVDRALPGDQEALAFREWADGAVENLEDFDRSTETTADSIRRNLIENGLDPAQEKLNEFGEGALDDARLSDATKRLANDIADVGYAADGSKQQIKLLDGELDTSTESGRRLDEQVRAVKDSLDDQARAAVRNGESQKEVRARVEQARTAFIDQMTAMGLTEAQAGALADEYGLIPKKVSTEATLRDHASSKARDVKDAIDGIPSEKTITITTIRQVLGTDSGGPSQYVMRRAGGGPAIGPGSATSDSIHALLSNGEHVWTASDVQKAGGQSAMYRMRADVQAGLLRYASGGAVGQAENAVERARRLSLSARRALADARRDERRARSESAQRAAERRVERYERLHDERQQDVDEARARLERVRQEASSLRTDLRRGSIRDSVTGGLSGALGVTDQLRDLAQSGDVSRYGSRRLTNVAGDAERALTGLYKQTVRVDQRIESATDNLSKWQQIADGVSSSINGAFSLGGVSGGVDPWTGQERQATGQQILAATEQYREKARNLVLKLRELQAAGYGTAVLQEVAGAGVEAGVAMADALLTLSPKDVRALQQNLADVEFYAGRAGIAATDDQVTSARRAVEAAEAQAAAIDKRIDGWAKRLGSEMARALGIKARANGGPVTAGHAYLVNENTPNSELFVPSQSGYVLNNRQMSGLSAGPQKVVNVYVTQNYPQQIPYSKAVNNALQHAAEGVV